MSQEMSTAVLIAVSVILTSMFLYSASVASSIVRQVANVQQNELNAVQDVQEYRKEMAYNNSEVYAPDIVNLLFQTRGTPEIWVDALVGVGDDFTLKWTKLITPAAYTTEDLMTIIPEGKYLSSIIKDENGSISRYEFRR